MITHIIQLHESDTAICGGITFTAKGNRYDPVPPLVRRLIGQHLIESTDLVEIRRGDLLCFKPCRASLLGGSRHR